VSWGQDVERRDLVPADAESCHWATPSRDGLGYELESALGTCATRTSTAPGVSCAAIADPRDTDGDGISDGLEAAVGIGGDDLPLPLWGADPRHKDLFVEVDFMRRTKAENDAETTLNTAWCSPACPGCS
jgi:hypothetical protein